MYVCYECHSEIDPSSPDVVYAVRLHIVDTFMSTAYREGTGFYFHESCYPRALGLFRPKPKPGASDALQRAS
jgi:hypothetical protein